MTKVYDNWERLVWKTLRREQLRQIALRALSDLSFASSSSFNSSSSFGRPSSFALPGDGPTLPTLFTFSELATATNNFSPDFLLGKGGYVYKGRLESGQIIAVKRCINCGHQRIAEFVIEVSKLNMLHHPNIANLTGYCTEFTESPSDFELLLVYEFMPRLSLYDYFHGRQNGSLDWETRMKIAVGVAKGLGYLCNKVEAPALYKNLKLSNILLDGDFHPKLSYFGLAEIGHTHVGDKVVSAFLMETYGFHAPEFVTKHYITFKSVIYKFGVVLLQLITGRKVIDDSRAATEQSLVAWARPRLKRKKFEEMADPLLGGEYPKQGLYRALELAAECLQLAAYRPPIEELVPALTDLATRKEPSAIS